MKNTEIRRVTFDDEECLPSGHPYDDESSLEPHIEKARKLRQDLQALIKAKKKPPDYDRTLSALILLTEEAARRGLGVRALASRLPGKNRKHPEKPMSEKTLKQCFMTHRPQAIIAPLTRVLRYHGIVARALRGELTRDDVLYVLHLLNDSIIARRVLFLDSKHTQAAIKAVLERMPMEERREALACYLLAGVGLVSQEPFDALGESLRPHGFHIEEYYAQNGFERRRQARVAMMMIRESLAPLPQQWKILEDTLAPLFGDYPPMMSRVDDDNQTQERIYQEFVVTAGMRAILRAEYGRRVAGLVESVDAKLDKSLAQRNAERDIRRAAVRRKT
jgi:hypothetical protein